MNVSDPLNYGINPTDMPGGRDTAAFAKMSLDGERLARLETKVDLILEHQEAFRKSFEKHDDRLKHLEALKVGIFAIAATVGALSAFLIEGVRKIVTH